MPLIFVKLVVFLLLEQIMKQFVNVILLFSVVLFSQSSMAAVEEAGFDGYAALNLCSVDRPDMKAGCSMFVLGATEAFRIQKLEGKHYCLPELIDNKDLTRAFYQYLRGSRDKLHYSAVSLYFGSLMAIFPCNSSKSNSNSSITVN